MTGALAGVAVLLVFAAVWELSASAGERLALGVRAALTSLSGGRAGSLDEAARLRLAQRIARAGLAGKLEPGNVIAGKLAGVAVGALLALVAAPAVAPRLALAVAGLLVCAGFFAPDAWLERRARRRRRRFVAALPDALDMLAVGTASGRSPATVFGEVAAGTSGPLALELGSAVAEIECGSSVRDAIARLRTRVPGAEVGALASAIERSQTYGSPLGEQLHLQATTLRLDARRRISDHAARAAPKIQLTVALVLVPSVLVTIVAAILAHSDALFGRY